MCNTLLRRARCVKARSARRQLQPAIGWFEVCVALASLPQEVSSPVSFDHDTERLPFFQFEGAVISMYRAEAFARDGRCLPVLFAEQFLLFLFVSAIARIGVRK